MRASLEERQEIRRTNRERERRELYEKAHAYRKQLPPRLDLSEVIETYERANKRKISRSKAAQISTLANPTFRDVKCLKQMSKSYTQKITEL